MQDADLRRFSCVAGLKVERPRVDAAGDAVPRSSQDWRRARHGTAVRCKARSRVPAGATDPRPQMLLLAADPSMGAAPGWSRLPAGGRCAATLALLPVVGGTASGRAAFALTSEG